MRKPPFLGWRKHVVWMPGGHQLVCYFFRDGATGPVHLDDLNRNVYRLDSQGEIVWQVQRDDSNHPPDWWEGLHRHAREEGYDGAHEPFMRIWVQNPDGNYQSDANGHRPAEVQHWKPGCTLHLDGSAYQHYLLDPDTGIAKNVTELPVRPW